VSGEERRSAPNVHTTEFTVEFGDCDPARIVFYPNFFRWMDSAARHYFEAAGLPSWRETEATDGIIGAPLVAVESSIAEWRGRSFVMRHLIRRGGELLVEGTETRIFARLNPEDPTRIQAVELPERFRLLLC
jgi:4-hydroxybenzoyl-CoA thioesterase